MRQLNQVPELIQLILNRSSRRPVPFLHSLASCDLENLSFAYYCELNDLDLIYSDLMNDSERIEPYARE